MVKKNSRFYGTQFTFLRGENIKKFEYFNSKLNSKIIFFTIFFFMFKKNLRIKERKNQETEVFKKQIGIFQKIKTFNKKKTKKIILGKKKILF